MIPFIFSCAVLIFYKDNFYLNSVCNLSFISFVGKISYSLYLTHFPIFAFSRIIDFTKGNIEKKLLLGLLIIIFSLLSYRLIEVPLEIAKKLKFIPLAYLVDLV